MAIHKARVIGLCKIDGVAAPGTVVLDDERVNVQALIDGEHIEILPGPRPGSKEFLAAQAKELGLSTEGSKADLEARIAEALKKGDD